MVDKNNRTTELDFGWLKGTPLAEVPATYLHWMARTLINSDDRFPDRKHWAVAAVKELVVMRRASDGAFSDIKKRWMRHALGLTVKPVLHESNAWDIITTKSGKLIQLRPGVVLCFQYRMESPIEHFQRGSCIVLVQKTKSDPYGYKNPNGNWLVGSTAGTTVWASVQGLIYEEVLSPLTHSSCRPKFDWNGDTIDFLDLTADCQVKFNVFEAFGVATPSATASEIDDLLNEIEAGNQVAKSQVASHLKPDFAIGQSVVILDALNKGGTVSDVAAVGVIEEVFNDCQPIRYAVNTGYYATTKTYDEVELANWSGEEVHQRTEIATWTPKRTLIGKTIRAMLVSWLILSVPAVITALIAGMIYQDEVSQLIELLKSYF